MAKKPAKAKPKVKILRLVGGTVVIGTITYNADNREYNINKPLEIVAVPHPNDHSKSLIIVNDFVPGSKQEDIQIGKQHVMCPAAPDEGMLELYEKMTKPPSDIATPPEKKLIVPG